MYSSWGTCCEGFAVPGLCPPAEVDGRFDAVPSRAVRGLPLDEKSCRSPDRVPGLSDMVGVLKMVKKGV